MTFTTYWFSISFTRYCDFGMLYDGFIGPAIWSSKCICQNPYDKKKRCRYWRPRIYRGAKSSDEFNIMIQKDHDAEEDSYADPNGNDEKYVDDGWHKWGKCVKQLESLSLIILDDISKCLKMNVISEKPYKMKEVQDLLRRYKESSGSEKKEISKQIQR